MIIIYIIIYYNIYNIIFYYNIYNLERVQSVVILLYFVYILTEFLNIVNFFPFAVYIPCM